MTKPYINSVNGNFISKGILSGNWQAQEIADLDQIFRNVLSAHTVNGGIIFRCDKLPLSPGNPEYFTCLFDAIISMIVSHPPFGSKLFLYVKCFPEVLDSDVMDLRENENDAPFKIEIYSNITTDKDWEMSYQAKLADCNVQSTRVSGNFSFTPIANTGCLFSLTLRGKIN